jgi:hypothetical protein
MCLMPKWHDTSDMGILCSFRKEELAPFWDYHEDKAHYYFVPIRGYSVFKDIAATAPYLLRTTVFSYFKYQQLTI